MYFYFFVVIQNFASTKVKNVEKFIHKNQSEKKYLANALKNYLGSWCFQIMLDSLIKINNIPEMGNRHFSNNDYEYEYVIMNIEYS
jgi:hypothetical protein